MQESIAQVKAMAESNPAVAVVAGSTLAYIVWSYFGSGSKSSSKLPLVPLKAGGLPLIGNIEFNGDKGAIFKSLKGQVTRFKIFNQNIIVFPAYEYEEELKKLEGTHHRGGNTLSSIKQLMGKNSILNVHGKEHKVQRRAILPVFRPSDLIKTSKQIQGILKPAFKKLAEKDFFSVGPEIEDFAFTLGMTFIGIQFDSDQRAFLEEQAHTFVASSLTFPVDLGKYSLFGRGVMARKELIGIARKSMEATRKAMAAGEPEKHNVMERMLKCRDENGNPLDDETLLNTMLVFIVGSFDTTCASMTSVVLNMCRFPEIQEKTHAHIRDVLGADSDEFHGRVEIPDERWKELDYVDAVVLETQRYTPPMAPSATRICTKDFELRGKYRIEKGTVLMWEAYTPTRNPKLWPNVDEFDPERFNLANPEYKRNIACLATFGGGTRQCIGRGFAKIELQIFVTLLLRDYKVEFAKPDDAEPELMYPFTFVMDSPLYVKFTKRVK